MSEPGGLGAAGSTPAPDSFGLYARLAGGVLVVLDEGGTVMAAQPADGMLLGRPAGDLEGGSLLGLVHEDDRALVGRLVAALFDGTTVRADTLEIRLAGEDGTWRWFELQGAPLNQPQGGSDTPSPGAVAVLVHDVDERRRANDRLRASEGRFRALVEQSRDVFVVVDPAGAIRYTSPSVEAVLGWLPDEFAELNRRVVHPADLDQAGQVNLTESFDPSARRVVRLRHRDGSWRWLEATGVDLSHDPRVAGAVYTLRLTVAPESGWARRRNSRLLAIAEATTDLVVLVEPDLGSLYLNPVARRFFGLREDQPDQFNPRTLFPEDTFHQWTEEIVPALLDTGNWQGEMSLRDAIGRLVPHQAELIAHLDDNGQVDVLSGIARDVSERKDLESRLEHAATHDPLTGLPNRALFVDRLQVAIGRSRRTGRPPAVLFCDLDRFKLINDSHGHAVGDLVLTELAARLLRTLRPGDAVARFGGDEFLVLCEDVTDEAEATIVADRVAGTLNRPVIVHGEELEVSASIGIAYSTAPDSPEDLLRDADAAMYQAKERRRNGPTPAAGGRERTNGRRLSAGPGVEDHLGLADDLRWVLDRHQLAVYFQPKISIATGRVAGTEALLRWQHPERGLLRPGQFLSLAESTGQLGPIGRWVAGEACRATERLRQLQPRGSAGLLTSLNLSASQLADDGLTADLGRTLVETQLDPALVSVEIGGALFGGNGGATGAALARLRGLGVQVSVDDVGLADVPPDLFSRLAVDLLKVDPRLVAGLGGDGAGVDIRAVIDVAHGMGIQAAAKGVETARQLAQLRRLDCDLAQGYFIAHPMPEAQLADLLGSAPMWWVFDSGGRSGVWTGWRS